MLDLLEMKEEVYDSPVNDEIVILMPNDSVSNRGILVHYRDDGLQHDFIMTSSQYVHATYM